jgi:hypothetical protein
MARLSACTRQRGPREAALLAHRRAQSARRRREVVAQLRRRWPDPLARQSTP